MYHVYTNNQNKGALHICFCSYDLICSKTLFENTYCIGKNMVLIFLYKGATDRRFSPQITVWSKRSRSFLRTGDLFDFCIIAPIIILSTSYVSFMGHWAGKFVQIMSIYFSYNHHYTIKHIVNRYLAAFAAACFPSSLQRKAP